MATRPDSILRRVSGEMPASSATLSIDRSPPRAPQQGAEALAALDLGGVSGIRTIMMPILIPG